MKEKKLLACCDIDCEAGEERLIDKYLPSDYSDSVSKMIKRTEPISPDHIFEDMFCNFPKPVDWLFKLRNVFVKPFGLQGGGFKSLISERNDGEIILSKNDKHLCFRVGIYCSTPVDCWQEVSVTTVVNYNNFLGRIYFIGIWLFHKLLVKSLFRKAIKS